MSTWLLVGALALQPAWAGRPDTVSEQLTWSVPANGPIAGDAWWQEINDGALHAILDEAWERNGDLRSAQERVRLQSGVTMMPPCSLRMSWRNVIVSLVTSASRLACSMPR